MRFLPPPQSIAMDIQERKCQSSMKGSYRTQGMTQDITVIRECQGILNIVAQARESQINWYGLWTLEKRIVFFYFILLFKAYSISIPLKTICKEHGNCL